MLKLTNIIMNRLMSHAKKLRIENVLRTYIEILL